MERRDFFTMLLGSFYPILGYLGITALIEKTPSTNLARVVGKLEVSELKQTGVTDLDFSQLTDKQTYQIMKRIEGFVEKMKAMEREEMNKPRIIIVPQDKEVKLEEQSFKNSDLSWPWYNISKLYIDEII